MQAQISNLSTFGFSISIHPGQALHAPRFSIVVPTWNNLPFLKCCVESIRKNSVFLHQIILHINEGTDGTRQWAEEQGLDYSYSEKNVGICHAMNAAATLARTEYLAYLNDDMYCCPGWDAALWEAIEAAGTKDFFLSGTMIEPVGTGNTAVLAPHDFGRSPENFDENGLLSALPELTRADWSGATWPPNVVPLRLWQQVGGYSVEFTPGMYSDPDFSAKLWTAGVRYFRGVGSSRVYHFMSKSTGRVKKPVKGSSLFVRKWGITAQTFQKHFLRRGQPFTGALPEPEMTAQLQWEIIKGKIKRRLV